MASLLKRGYRRLKRLLGSTPQSAHAIDPGYDFNKSNPLGGNGERVDIQIQGNVEFEKLDIYQKNHWKRYEFARQVVETGDVCGDFACGTGYGSILVSDKAKSVTGADLNSEVITKIQDRYKQHTNVAFLNANLLYLDFENYFDTIISFETLEHFDEANVRELLEIFNKALKKNGKLIFSTPYMQERSEEAVKMGFHLTFYINEEKIANWLQTAGFRMEIIKYQNYDTHILGDDLQKKEFIICVARKTDV